MVDYKLCNVDGDDIDDLLLAIEKSFQVRFKTDEFATASTFGELCDCITNKIQLEHTGGCTTQQAFYKLRNAFHATSGIEHIRPGTLLTDLLPKHNRHSRVKHVENQLGFKLSILRPPHFVTNALVLIFLASIISLFIAWKTGLTGLILSLTCIYFSNLLGKELRIQTVGELADQLTQRNYTQARRNPATYNRDEIGHLLVKWFSESFDLHPSELGREAKL